MTSPLTGPTPTQSLTEDLIDVIEAFGAPRPTSMGLSELYQDLTGAIRSFSGIPSGWISVVSYGADPSGTLDSTAAIRAAAGALNSAGGGVLYFPPGTYRCTGSLQYYPYTTWQGVPGASIIHLSTELWPGGTAPAAYFITPAGGPDSMPHQGPCILRGLNIYGPAAASLGQTHSHTVGVQTANHCYYEHLVVSNFYVGVRVCSNHETFFGCYITGNYYNAQYFFVASLGDQTFYSCKLDGSGLAGLCIESPSSMQGVELVKVHSGFAPCGILKTDAQNQVAPWDANGNPSYTEHISSSSVPILDCNFLGFQNEQVGNGAILDISTLGYFARRTRFRTGWIWNASFATTANPLGSALAPTFNPVDFQGAWAINTRSIDLLTRFEGVPAGGTPGSVGVIKVSGTAQSPTFETDTLPANFFGSGTDWSVLTAGSRFELKSWVTAIGEAIGMSTPGANPINVGDCVELTAGGSSVQRATGTKPFFGVALTSAPGGGQAASVAVFVRGLVQINTPVASIPTNSVLYLSTATPYMVDATSTTNPPVGFAFQPGTASAPLSVVVQLNR